MSDCRGCRFWDVGADDPWLAKIGDCKRYPPKVIGYYDGGGQILEFPRTEHDELCGEFRSGCYKAYRER